MKKSKLVNVCQNVGVILLDSGDCISIDAPFGYHFKNTDMHYFEIYTRYQKRKDIYIELFNIVKNGVEKCVNENCEYCVHDYYN